MTPSVLQMQLVLLFTVLFVAVLSCCHANASLVSTTAAAAAATAASSSSSSSSAPFLHSVLFWMWFKPHTTCDASAVQEQWKAVQDNKDLVTHISTTMHFIEIVHNESTGGKPHALFGDHAVCDLTKEARSMGIKVCVALVLITAVFSLYIAISLRCYNI